MSLAAAAVVVLLLGVAYLFARIARHAGLPPPAAVVLVGIAAGAILPREFSPRLSPEALAIFLPVLIFEAAWEIDAVMLRRVALPIFVLAVPGVAITLGTIAAAGLVAHLPLGAAVILGGILSATDPLTVVALFRQAKASAVLLTLVEGESIANDGVAVVMVAALIPIATGVVPSVNWISTALSMIYVSVAGAAAGALLAVLAAPLMRHRGAFERILFSVAVAYGSYFLASAVGASGIFASAAAGIALPVVGLQRDATIVRRFWDCATLTANAIVFLLVGLSLRLERMFHEPWLIVAVMLAVIVSRVILAYVLVPLFGSKLNAVAHGHAIALAGLRGGLSIALALALPATLRGRAEIIDAVFAVVFLTLIVQGWALAPLLRRLKLTEHVNRSQ